MRYSEFTIKNFKGINDLTFKLDKSPSANIYTLVGLNESGKTTILEAINLFNPNDKELKALDIPGTKIEDFNSLIPISRRDNFSDDISITVTLKLDANDHLKINEFAETNTSFSEIYPIDEISYNRNYKYKDSVFIKLHSTWTGLTGIPKGTKSKKHINIANKVPKDNVALAKFCSELIPGILYFPNFLFDFPTKIFLETKEQPTVKEKFYLDLIQDILSSLSNGTNIKTHLVDRIKSKEKSQEKNLDRLLQRMGIKVTEVIFDAWAKIFKRKIIDTRVVIHCHLNEKDLPYLEFEIEATDGIYQINERSLGFRWFFVFLLFTQFRPFRENSPKNIIYLFDEPASNLHSSAQKQLLKSFENLTENSKIIYTTHSHHLINPSWLESTYVVINEGLNLENHETYNTRQTNVAIKPYREFVMDHPHNTAYFQPILDVLDYAPSSLESLPDCTFMEGKNDFYTLAYFQDVILSQKNKLNLTPSTGSANLDTLISLYIGWGKEFIILLDSDTAGDIQKQRYIEKFGIIVERRIFTLEDVDPTWAKTEMEKLFDKTEVLEFQKTAYPNSTKFNKTHFNRAIQEALINRTQFSFNNKTKENITKILHFINSELQKFKPQII